MSHQQTSPPLPLRGARKLHKGGGCAPRTGRCPPRGWQQGRDQPTARGTVNVVWRHEIRIQRGAGRWDRSGCPKGAPRSANRQGEEQHRHTEHGSHTKRDEGEHNRQGGGAQQGRRGNQDWEPEWRGWESVRMGGSNLASQPRRYRGARATRARPASGGGCLPQPGWAVCATGTGAHQGQTSREGERDIWWTVWTTRGGAGHLGLTHTETQRDRLWTACGQRRVDSKNSQTTLATTTTTSTRQLEGATDAPTAHHATSSTALAHQPLGSANAETTPAGAPAAAADRKQQPDAT